MESRQLELPFFTPNVWEKMDPEGKSKTVNIMAKMILQIVQNQNGEENNDNNNKNVIIILQMSQLHTSDLNIITQT